MNFELDLRLSAVAHRLPFAFLLSVLAISQAGRSEVRAENIIYGSGENADLSVTFQRDSHWNIVAIPANNNIGSPSTPYQAYVPKAVYGGWVNGGTSGPGGSQPGLTYDGNTYYWITPSSTTDSIVSPIGEQYNWIAAQTFTITSAGNYEFNFFGAGDDEMRFYINGTIDTTDLQKPTITGGTQIGGVGTYWYVNQYTGTAFMTAGTHTAYMLLYNAGGDTGALIGQSTFAAVPEPSTYCMALAGLACGGYSMLRRRKRA
jgi:hypothetical protein